MFAKLTIHVSFAEQSRSMNLYCSFFKSARNDCLRKLKITDTHVINSSYELILNKISEQGSTIFDFRIKSVNNIIILHIYVLSIKSSKILFL